MRLLRSFFVLFLCYFSITFCEEEKSLPFSDDERGLPTLVGGCVNIITGDYVESDVDLVVPGPVPLTFERFYSSSDYETHSLFWGWRHNLDSQVNILGSKAVYVERNGRTGVYHGHDSYVFSPKSSGKGYTNCGTRCISARTNIKNNRIHYHDGDLCVYSGSGTVRTFSAKRNGAYALSEEKYLTGNKTLYYYKDKNLRKVKTVNGVRDTTFAQLYFDVDENNARYVVRSNDGREVVYHLEKFRDRTRDEKKMGWDRLYHIKKVVRSDAHPIKYEYTKVSKAKNEHISKRILPNGRFRKISYNKNNKVEWIRGPKGLLHRFEYLVGITKAYDAYGNLTKYSFDTNHRLYAMTKYCDDALHSKEWFSWNDEGELINHRICTGNKEIKKSRSFEYDKHGNIICETLTGNISGKGEDDRYQKYYTYSKKHLLLEEKEDNGLTIKYCYNSKSRLLESKCVCDHDHILRRTCYEYNSDGVLIKEIVDDGDNFSERRMTYITPTTTIPYGLPEIIDEKYLDFVTGDEKLLSRVIKTYTPQGWLMNEEHYDAELVHRYTLEWIRDPYGNVIEETNALGEKIKRRYDENSNLIFEQGPSQEYYKLFAYDCENNCIREDIVTSDAMYTKHHTYDRLSRCIQTIDYNGNAVSYEYDGLGQVKKIHYPNAMSISKAYDIFGNASCITDQKGKKTVKEYKPGLCEKLQPQVILRA